MNIKIEAIHHDDQRYETTGDWMFVPAHLENKSFPDQETLLINVSRELGDWRYIACVGVHELIEALLCKHAGITDEDVTAFDEEFEQARESVGRYPQIGEDVSYFEFRGRRCDANAESGDDQDAPYRLQHCIATGVERLLAAVLGVDWNTYDAACHALSKGG